MIRDLTEQEMQSLLCAERMGHLGCCLKDRPYVVPTTYAYDGRSIYIYTHNGEKVDMMKKNPQVCLQVENVASESAWKSVMVHGLYEELRDEKLVEAIRMLKEHTEYREVYAPFKFDETGKQLYNRGKLIHIFRIVIREMHGRAHEKED